MILSWSWLAQINRAWKPFSARMTPPVQPVVPAAASGPQRPSFACSTLLSQVFLLPFPDPAMPSLTSSEEGRKDGEEEEWWGARPKLVLEGQVWGASHPKGKAWDARCREVLFSVVAPPCPCQSWGRWEAEMPESILTCCPRAGVWLLLRTEHHPLLGKNERAVRGELWMPGCGAWCHAKAEPGLHGLQACLCAHNHERWAAGCSWGCSPHGPVFS